MFSSSLSPFVLPATLLLLTLLSGFWLSNAGKPYNGLLFNIHKLIALGAVILMGVRLFYMLKIADPPALTIAAILISAICVVALFASGALMSIGKLDYALTLMVHRIALAAIVISLGFTVLGLS